MGPGPALVTIEDVPNRREIFNRCGQWRLPYLGRHIVGYSDHHTVPLELRGSCPVCVDFQHVQVAGCTTTIFSWRHPQIAAILCLKDFGKTLKMLLF
jgi:hypothetical protein